jgi:hypothetical protein
LKNFADVVASMWPQLVRDLVKHLNSADVAASMCPQFVRDLVEYLKELR